MVSMLKRSCAAALMAAALLVVSTAGVAQAVDAPKWVAAMHVEAQKMVGLRWMPVSGATGYKVLRSTTAGSGYAEIASTAAPQHFDKDLQPGTTYYYVLQAVTGAEVSPNSGEKKVAIPGEKKVEKTLPPQWDKLNVSSTTEFGKTHYKAGVFWKPVRNSLAYNVYRSTTAGKDYELVSSTSENRIVDTNIEAGKTYYYVLTALDQSFVETPYSEEKSLSVEAKKVAAAKKKKKKKKKEYPKLVPIPTSPGGEASLADYPADVAVDEDGTIFYSARGLWALDDVESDPVSRSDESWDVRGIGIGIDGEILGAVASPSRVVIFDGSRMTEIPIPPLEKALRRGDKVIKIKPVSILDVAQNIDGKYWVTDSSNNRVLIFDEDREFIGHAGAGSEQEMVPNASYVAAVGDGKVFVAAGSMNYVNIYDQEGVFVKEFGETGSIASTFGRIGSISPDGEGNIFISDGMNGTIQKFDSDGKFLGALSAADGKGSIDLATPKAVAVGPGGKDVYVVEGLTKKLKLLTILE